MPELWRKFWPRWTQLQNRSARWFEQVSETLQWGEIQLNAEEPVGTFELSEDVAALLKISQPLSPRAQLEHLKSYFEAGLWVESDKSDGQVRSFFYLGQIVDCRTGFGPRLNFPRVAIGQVKSMSGQRLLGNLRLDIPLAQSESQAYLLAVSDKSQLILLSRRPALWEKDRIETVARWLLQTRQVEGANV